MLRRAALVTVCLLAACACKKADSKEPAANTADSRVAVDKGGSTVADGSGSTVGTADVTAAADAQVADPKGSGNVKGSDKGTSVEGAAKGSDSTAGDTSFTLTITAPDPVAAGAPATAKLVVKPGKGYHMNKDFPTKLTIEPPAGVTLAKTTFEGEDAEAFTDDHLVFAVDCTPGSTGTYTVSGKLKFAVCTESTCDPKRQAISFAVAAK